MGSGKCALCRNHRNKASKLCGSCDNQRLESASYERTASGAGLTYSNVERYSEANWIKAVKAGRAKS